MFHQLVPLLMFKRFYKLGCLILVDMYKNRDLNVSRHLLVLPCTLMFITSRRCIWETWDDVQYEAYRMRRRRAHLTLAAWHTMILSQYFLLFILCVSSTSATIMSRFFIICANRVIQLHFCGTAQMYVWNRHICRVRGVPSKNYRHQPCCMHALASTTTNGMCGALC